MKSIYMAASSQHVGKTTCTLGLVSALMREGYHIGYCKPVGQKSLEVDNLRVDKDTVLFADLIDFELDPELHSPIILGPGATTKFLDDPGEFDLESDIRSAATRLGKTHDIVIFEGTGHPGVGSVAGMSNAHVAKIVKAPVIMVVEGGVGSTIDMLNMNLALFREEGVPILGVIVNKVIPEKMEMIRFYLNKWLEPRGIPILGLIPYEKSLAFPVMRTVADSISGLTTHNHEFLDNKVEDIVAGSLIDIQELKSFENVLLVAAVRQLEPALDKVNTIMKVMRKTKSPLTGIVLTGQGTPESRSIDYILKHKIPMVRTELDTYGSVLQISKIEVKINRNTPWKVRRAIELIGEYVDLDLIRERLGLIVK
ncbi:MAG: dethiobiotin synthase [Bacteroidota bacterium]|nr:dethiobiotin synthase [Bacteroidota bacterium]